MDLSTINPSEIGVISIRLFFVFYIVMLKIRGYVKCNVKRENMKTA